MENKNNITVVKNLIENIMRFIYRSLFLSMLLIINSTFVQASTYHETPHIKKLIIKQTQYAKKVYPALALAVADVESNFNPNAVSSAGAVGVMQIMPHTAKTVFGVRRNELFEPRKNIALGIKFLDQLIERYGGNTHFALSHYNGGSKVGQWPNSKIIPYTKNYVEKVLAKSKYYQKQLSQEQQPKNISHFLKHSRGSEPSKSTSNIQASLEEIDFWLSKSRLIPKDKLGVKNSLNLKKKMKANRKSFRQWLKVQNL